MERRLSGLRAGIVGGSVGGCATAIALAQAGCEVTVFERSSGRLEDRGAGIGLPIPMVASLRDRGLIGDDFAYLTIANRYYAIPSDAHMGRLLWRQSMGEMALANWGVLFRQLRARVPDAAYRTGQEVVAVDASHEDHGTLKTADGTTHAFDLVVCADGYESMARTTLSPQTALEYTGYIAWRGLINETLVPGIESYESEDIRQLDGQHVLMGARGHGIVYLVPGRRGETAPGRRLLNWLWYENVPEEDLVAALGGRHGQATSVSPGDLPEARVAYLRSEARRLFPTYFANMVDATEQPFVQAIFDLHVSSYRRGRVCLLGDAATVVRPNSASGVTHALTNALDLADTLTTHASVDEALGAWDAAQTAGGQRLLRLAQAVGDALQDTETDWAAMSPGDMERWWATVMSGHHWYVTEPPK